MFVQTLCGLCVLAASFAQMEGGFAGLKIAQRSQRGLAVPTGTTRWSPVKAQLCKLAVTKKNARHSTATSLACHFFLNPGLLVLSGECGECIRRGLYGLITVSRVPCKQVPDFFSLQAASPGPQCKISKNVGRLQNPPSMALMREGRPILLPAAQAAILEP